MAGTSAGSMAWHAHAVAAGTVSATAFPTPKAIASCNLSPAEVRPDFSLHCIQIWACEGPEASADSIILAGYMTIAQQWSIWFPQRHCNSHALLLLELSILSDGSASLSILNGCVLHTARQCLSAILRVCGTSRPAMPLECFQS